MPIDEVSRSLSATKNYILIDTNTALDLSKCQYQGESGSLLLSNLPIALTPANLTRNGFMLSVSAKGIYLLDFLSGSTKIPIVLIAKTAAETEYVLFQDSFTFRTNGPIPTGYTLDVGTAAITNGKLVLDGRTSNPTRVLLPSYLAAFGNYIIETDLTIQSVDESSRWASFMFRYGTTGYFQMAVRQNAMAANGVEFAKWLNGNWNVTNTASYTENFGSSTSYRLKMDVYKDVVKEYINGSLLITSEIANDLSVGKLGMQAKGAVAAFNNIKVALPVGYTDVETINLTEIPTVYVPETGISLPPAVMTWAKSLSDLQAMSQTVRPQVLVMSVDASLNVVTPDNTVILSLLDALQLIDARVIPAFYVTDSEIAEALAEQLRDYGVMDVFIISPDPAVITMVRHASSVIRGILEIVYDELKPELNDTNRLAIRNAVNTCGAVGALLPSEYVTTENIDYLQNRFLTVYADVSDEASAVMFQSVLSGADGILTTDLSAVYAFFALFPENSILRHPMVIAHRGLVAGAPENSIEGALLAYQAGADAIELDIYITTDGRLVVIHDATTTRTTNGDLTVENSTLAQLKALVLDDSSGNFPGCQIPTLDQYFTAFKGLDVQLLIEIKSSSPQIVSALDNLINQVGISSQVIVISKIVLQLERTRELIPEVSIGFLNQSITEVTNMSGCIQSVLNMIIPLKSAYNPEYFQISEAFLAQIHYRGLFTYPWTLDTLTVLHNYYVMDVGGVTTGITDYINDDPLFYEISQSEYTVDLSAPIAGIALTGVSKTLDGQTVSLIPQTILLDNGGTGIQIDESAYVSNFSHSGTALILVYHSMTFDDAKTYVVFDSLVRITVVGTVGE
jgi:glycerophosphoryl diester phosphodiesterase